MIQPVERKKKGQSTLKLPEKMFQASTLHSNQLLEAHYTAGTSNNSVMYRV